MELSTLLNSKINSISFIENLFERTNTGFFAKDHNGKIISANTFMLSIYGAKKKADIMGKRDADFFPPYIAKPIRDDDNFVLSKGQILLDKIEMIPFIDFKLYWLKTSKYPIFDINNEVIGLIGVTSKLKESQGYVSKNKKLINVLTYIEDNADKKITLDALCDITMMSKTSLLRHFKETFNISPMAYLKKVRLHLACQMLKNSDKDLLSIAYSCGYHDQSHFNKEFKSMLDTTPRKYKLDFEKKSGK